MRKFILLLFGFALLLSASAESQTLKSISGKDTPLTLSENKTNKAFSGNFKLSAKLNRGYGVIAEFQYSPSMKNAWVLSVQHLVREDIGASHDNALFIILGPKFYFSDNDLKGYFSFNFGILSQPDTKRKLLFALLFGLGIQYDINESINLNAEIKPNLNLPWDLENGLMLFLNAGIGVKLF
jgi:opacity protein-like surface antigen